MLSLSEKELQEVLHKRDMPEDPTTAKKAIVRAKAGKSLATGKAFENLISISCERYRTSHDACIIKTPEPFAVFSRTKDGLFKGRFTQAKAQPDFHGILKNGKTIVFEAKSTSKDRMQQGVLTDTQKELLSEYASYGALSFVAVNISDQYFWIPFSVWTEMKERYGRKYVTPADIPEYEILPIKHNPLPFLSHIQEDEK